MLFNWYGFCNFVYPLRGFMPGLGKGKLQKLPFVQYADKAVKTISVQDSGQNQCVWTVRLKWSASPCFQVTLVTWETLTWQHFLHLSSCKLRINWFTHGMLLQVLKFKVVEYYLNEQKIYAHCIHFKKQYDTLNPLHWFNLCPSRKLPSCLEK